MSRARDLSRLPVEGASIILTGRSSLGDAASYRKLAHKANDRFDIRDMFGCDLSGANDMAPTLAAAFADAKATGDVLHLPAGDITLGSTVAVPSGVNVLGVNTRPYTTLADSGSRGTGSWFHIAHDGVGLALANAGEFATGISFENIGTYRDQPNVGAGWTPNDYDFDFTVNNADAEFRNVMLLNATRGIRQLDGPAGRLYLDKVRGQPFLTGVQVDDSYDGLLIEGVRWWPFWSNDAFTKAFTKANRVGLYLRHCDNPKISGYFNIFSKTGVRIGGGPNGVVNSAYFYNLENDVIGGNGLEFDSDSDGSHVTVVGGYTYGDTGSTDAAQMNGNNGKLVLIGHKAQAIRRSVVRMGTGTGNVCQATAPDVNWNVENGGHAAFTNTTGNSINVNGRPIASGGNGARLVAGGAIIDAYDAALIADIAGNYNSATGYGTDDGPAILAALQSLSASGGGALIIPYSKKPYIGTSFEMPANTAIRFEHCPRGTHDGLALPSFSGTLWLSPAATITVGNGCEIHANLFRAGLTFGITSAQVAATFLGTAILLKSNCANIVIKGMIVGFEYSIEPQDPNNADGTKQHNRIELDVVYDCINGPHIHNSYDIGRHNSLHGWPFTTVTSASEANGAQLKRSGYALWLSGVNDWSMVFQHFSYGYGVGCRITNCGSVTIVNGGHDHVPGSTDGSIGYLIEGNAREITLVAPQAAGKQYGIVINSTTGTGRLACEVVAPRVWVTTTIGIDVQGGSVKVTGGTIRNDPITTPNGIGIKNRNAGTAEVTLIGVDFRGLAKAIENQASTSVLRHWLCTFSACNVLISDAYMPSIASAASIAPAGVDFTYNLTGTTSVGTISTPQRYTGKMITFICVAGVTFLTGGNIVLRTGANTPVAAGQTISFVSDGTNWRQV